MQEYKKVLGVCGLMAVLLAPQLIKQTDASESEVILNGEVSALLLDFTVPSEVEFTINPNASSPDQVFVSPEFTVINDSSAPISVSVSAFENNGGHTFTDVMPNAHGDWTVLGVAESTRDLALGIDVDPLGTNDWYTMAGAASDNIYAKEIQDSSDAILIGGIKPNSQIKLGLTANHGYSFDSPLTTQYRLTLIFELI